MSSKRKSRSNDLDGREQERAEYIISVLESVLDHHKWKSEYDIANVALYSPKARPMLDSTNVGYSIPVLQKMTFDRIVDITMRRISRRMIQIEKDWKRRHPDESPPRDSVETLKESIEIFLMDNRIIVEDHVVYFRPNIAQMIPGWLSTDTPNQSVVDSPAFMVYLYYLYVHRSRNWSSPHEKLWKSLEPQIPSILEALISAISVKEGVPNLEHVIENVLKDWKDLYSI